MSVRVGGVGVGVVILVVGFLLWIIASSVGLHLRSPIAVIVPTILYFSSVIYLLNAPKINEDDASVSNSIEVFISIGFDSSFSIRINYFLLPSRWKLIQCI